MAVKDEDKKEETVKVVGEIEEKRIKPAVIRRRAAKPKVEVEPEVEVEAKLEAAPEAKVEAEAIEEKPSAPEASKESAAKEEKVEQPAQAEPEKAAKEVKADEKAAPKEAKPDKAAKPGEDKKGAQVQKKEVKVFTKDGPPKKFAPTAHVFKMGKKRRRTRQHRQPVRKQQRIQSSRPLMNTEITTPKAAKMVIRIQ
ncbi:MAG: hypothetical protein IME98_05980, partial [Proteobacteria bacterium]|nr:hypothetical protein [Pseudomonadota bacterium]